MINPAHIQEAEIFGMPEYEPEVEECPQCGSKVEELYKCVICGLRCCEHCRTYLEKYMESFFPYQCAIDYLLEELEKVEDEAHKYWQLQEAAKKAATTGSHKDFKAYLELRKRSE